MTSEKADTIVLGIVTLGIMLAMIATAAFVGADVNWDLRNYHLYGGYRWLHGGYGHDMFAAQIQSFFNPTLDAFIVALMENLPPHGVALTIALLQSLIVPCLAQILRRTVLPALRDMPAPYRWAAITAIMTAAMTGAMTLSQIGTSYGDLLVAVPMMFSLMCLTEITTQPPSRHRTLWLMGMGFGAGLAVGLKMTNLVFIPGLIFCLCLQKQSLHKLFKLLAIFSVAYGIGWALTGGLWAWKLWAETGNPMFPLFNAIFQSPLIDATNIDSDPRFTAKSIIEALWFPFATALGDHPGAETSFADSRMALFILALPFLFWKKRQQWPSRLALIILLGYTLWVFLLGVQRYALILEMLSCLAVAMELGHIRAPVPRASAMILVACLTIAATSYPNWNNRIPWALIGTNGNWLGVHAPDILTQPHTLFIMLGDQPIAYVMPQLNPDNSFIRIGGNFRFSPNSQLWQQRTTRIAQHTGSLYTIGHGEPTVNEAGILHQSGWVRSNEPCLPLATAIEVLLACPMQRFAQG